MGDPAMMEGMMGAMKGNVAMMVPQTLIMGWINAFFAGFVLCMFDLPITRSLIWNKKRKDEQSLTPMVQPLVKLPFPLTPQFKSMLQAGVGTRDLDVRWVSSISWYFLTLFGLQPVYNFILGSNQGMFSLFLPSLLHLLEPSFLFVAHAPSTLTSPLLFPTNRSSYIYKQQAEPCNTN